MILYYFSHYQLWIYQQLFKIFKLFTNIQTNYSADKFGVSFLTTKSYLTRKKIPIYKEKSFSINKLLIFNYSFLEKSQEPEEYLPWSVAKQHPKTNTKYRHFIVVFMFSAHHRKLKKSVIQTKKNPYTSLTIDCMSSPYVD